MPTSPARLYTVGVGNAVYKHNTRPRPARRRVRCGPPIRGLEIESGDSPASEAFTCKLSSCDKQQRDRRLRAPTTPPHRDPPGAREPPPQPRVARRHPTPSSRRTPVALRAEFEISCVRRHALVVEMGQVHEPRRTGRVRKSAQAPCYLASAIPTKVSFLACSGSTLSLTHKCPCTCF